MVDGTRVEINETGVVVLALVVLAVDLAMIHSFKKILEIIHKNRDNFQY